MLACIVKSRVPFMIATSDFCLSIVDILDTIPHRYPFLLVDRVTQHEPGKAIHGYKNLTYNEPYFQGHFPGQPMMPGVLQVEALAQLGGILVGLIPEHKGKLGFFTGINNVRFRRQVIPGDCLEMEAEILKFRYPIVKLAVKGLVSGELAVEGEIMFALAERTI